MLFFLKCNKNASTVPGKNRLSKKNRLSAVLARTPKATLVERSQVEIEQFLTMLRFENRQKLEELPGFQK